MNQHSEPYSFKAAVWASVISLLKICPPCYRFLRKLFRYVKPISEETSCVQNQLISYAQISEDIWLYRAFQDQTKGFYIDIGANDPTLGSVTKLFYDRGWCGINVDPHPLCWQKLQQERVRDINVNVAIDDVGGVITLYAPEGMDGIASVNKEWITLDKVPLETYNVECMTLENLCKKYVPKHINEIDFMSIDVEGHEEKVLKGGNWNCFRPKIVLLEAVKPNKLMRHLQKDADYALWHDWENFFLSQGYIFAQFDGLNRYYVRQENPELLEHFVIPISWLTDKFVAHYPR